MPKVLSERSASPPGSFDPALVDVALSLARHFGARAEDAEDIAQEALLKLITYRETIEDPIPWLFVVIRRLQRPRTTAVDPQTSRRPSGIDPWPEVELKIDARRLLARISLRDRRSVCLSLAGFSEREAALQLGCSLKATEKSLHRARRQLRKLSGH